MKFGVMAIVFVLGVLPIAAAAQTTTDVNNQVTTMNTLTSNQGQNHVIGKISSDFSPFLGSDANAVVTGLRNGKPITLTSTTPGPTPGGLPVTTTTVITPPTGHMGFGNVYISLALAKQQLSTLGITQPTPQELQAALTGGAITQTNGTGATTTTDLQGVLTMRSQNMGWGQIAQRLGSKLGPVMSTMKSANQSLAASTVNASKVSDVTSASGKPDGSSAGGIVSGRGKTQGNSSAGASGGKGTSDGIVSASGRAGGNAYGLGKSAIVTGSGRSVAASGGVVSSGGGGNGAAHGKGNSK